MTKQEEFYYDLLYNSFSLQIPRGNDVEPLLILKANIKNEYQNIEKKGKRLINDKTYSQL